MSLLGARVIKPCQQHDLSIPQKADSEKRYRLLYNDIRTRVQLSRNVPISAAPGRYVVRRRGVASEWRDACNASRFLGCNFYSAALIHWDVFYLARSFLLYQQKPDYTLCNVSSRLLSGLNGPVSEGLAGTVSVCRDCASGRLVHIVALYPDWQPATRSTAYKCMTCNRVAIRILRENA